LKKLPIREVGKPIITFSWGYALAVSLILKRQLSPASQSPFSFAIFFSGGPGSLIDREKGKVRARFRDRLQEYFGAYTACMGINLK
jgi:hypothetical protein